MVNPHCHGAAHAVVVIPVRPGVPRCAPVCPRLPGHSGTAGGGFNAPAGAPRYFSYKGHTGTGHTGIDPC